MSPQLPLHCLTVVSHCLLSSSCLTAVPHCLSVSPPSHCSFLVVSAVPPIIFPLSSHFRTVVSSAVSPVSHRCLRTISPPSHFSCLVRCSASTSSSHCLPAASPMSPHCPSTVSPVSPRCLGTISPLSLRCLCSVRCDSRHGEGRPSGGGATVRTETHQSRPVAGRPLLHNIRKSIENVGT